MARGFWFVTLRDWANLQMPSDEVGNVRTRLKHSMNREAEEIVNFSFEGDQLIVSFVFLSNDLKIVH